MPYMVVTCLLGSRWTIKRCTATKTKTHSRQKQPQKKMHHTTISGWVGSMHGCIGSVGTSPPKIDARNHGCSAAINGCSAAINGCSAAINGCSAAINGCSLTWGVGALSAGQQRRPDSR
eukprot:2989788-Rhodomonas_salina.1